ncbi:class I SAM-dependent DNA methyltransferase [Roseofilum capinflatum]|uniref:Methyltransferase domain-containing protein n=1 Tax=Roseofilum capinflatum BLCC-M114 TaxID=3022440 RepID=A0ABT7B636_9CYAN|nr:methyltransferase domain-containing protein [Roseofilum capinflatum]MDJ1174630.1 methyltransferase domain-containing protein [Roseofilum capinflatum BLCC-M114]
MSSSFEVRLPDNIKDLPINEEYFFITENGQERRLKLHDYAEVYRIPGLYNYLALEKLAYRSPEVMTTLLTENLNNSGESVEDLRLLELGAGSGLFGQAAAQVGVTSIIGIDIVPEAAEACRRDCPGVYEDYFVEDMTQLSESTCNFLKEKDLNGFVCCSALSEGHIPVKAFVTGMNLIKDKGWVLFNVAKTSYECEDNCPEFVYFYRQLVAKGYLNVQATQTYIHRCFFNGKSLEYVAILAKKQQNIPNELS